MEIGNPSFNKSEFPIYNASAWPEYLVKKFKICNDQGKCLGDRLYGPLNSLLYWAFKTDTFEYVVEIDRETVDSAPYFIVCKSEITVRPFLLIEITDYLHVNNPSSRLDADIRMRKLYNNVLQECPLPQLFGLSMLGTSTRIYQGNTRTGNITPRFVKQPSEELLPDDFLADEWALDLLSTEGFHKMKEIVDYIVTHSEQSRKD